MSARAGMTLAELLAALVIAAVISTLLAQSLARLADQTGRLDRAGAGAETDLAAAQAFRRIVERAVFPLDGESPLETNEPDPAFVLIEDSLSFIAAEPGYPGRAGLYAYAVRVDRAGSQFRLVFDRAALADAPVTGEAMAARLARDGVSTVIWQGETPPALRVYDPSEAVWRDEWREVGPPALAALSLPGMASVVARLAGPAQARPGADGDQTETPAAGPQEPSGLGQLVEGGR